MLMVILGAGASYDSSRDFPTPECLGRPAPCELETWRPPLAPSLFLDPNHEFRPIVRKYLHLSHIIGYLRQPSDGRSVEEELEFLQNESNKRERLRELASVSYYLRDLLFQVTVKWWNQTSGVTNYAPLLEQILRLNSAGEPVCLVTFNYDLLLDHTLPSFDYKTMPIEDQFNAHPVFKVFKPHGSIDWARVVNLPPDRRMSPRELIEKADTITLTDQFVTLPSPEHADNGHQTVFPVIAIPVQTKTEDNFVWPESHRTHLEQLLPSVKKILIIGWQAREAHFLEMLQVARMKLTHLMVVGKDDGNAHLTLKHFCKELGQTPPKWSVGQKCFTHFVIHREGNLLFQT